MISMLGEANASNHESIVMLLLTKLKPPSRSS